MYKVFDFPWRYLEIYYYSWTAGSAAKHTKRIKKYLSINPYFQWQYLKDAEEKVEGRNEKGQEILIVPQGLKEFKRGEHPHVVVVDDPLKDPESPLLLTDIDKVTRIFMEEIMSMPKAEIGEVHILGTSQDKTDIFWQLENVEDCNWRIYRAIENGGALWPEKYPLDWLQKHKKRITAKVFDKEFMLNPFRRVEGYFSEAQLTTCMRNIQNRQSLITENHVYAGLDIGKKRNPSHFAIFVEMDKKLVQVHSKWMDGWNYIDQLEYCKQSISKFQIDHFYYDATRGEFEAFEEQNELPEEMEPVVFTAKEKSKLAEGFSREIENKTIILLSEERQRRQILMVGNDLKAPETPEGHGDAFWSIALAIEAARGGTKVEFIDVA